MNSSCLFHILLFIQTRFREQTQFSEPRGLTTTFTKSSLGCTKIFLEKKRKLASYQGLLAKLELWIMYVCQLQMPQFWQIPPYYYNKHGTDAAVDFADLSISSQCGGGYVVQRGSLPVFVKASFSYQEGKIKALLNHEQPLVKYISSLISFLFKFGPC